jgi:hypothetical protein
MEWNVNDLIDTRAFFSSCTVVPWLPDVTIGHLTPPGFRLVCACATGSCATPIVTQGHVTSSEVSMGCSLRRPRPIFSMVTGTSPGYLPLLFSYNASLYVITNYRHA